MRSAASGPEEVEEGPAEDLETYVVFSVDDRAFALDVDAVPHVLPLPRYTRAPTMSPHLLGVFHHAGRIMPLWDAHGLFGSTGPPPERPVVLVVQDALSAVGIAVDQVDEVITVPGTHIAPLEQETLPGPFDDVVLGALTVADAATARAPAAHRAIHERLNDPEMAPLRSLLAAAGRPDRGAAVLALLSPVRLLDVDRLLRTLGPALNGGDPPGRS